jgi:hypothetical protein
MCERVYRDTMLIGAEVVTARLEMVVDPAVGGEETARVTR